MNGALRPEPPILRRGKEFHRIVQAVFELDSGGRGAASEVATLLPAPAEAVRQRRGRVDVFVDVAEGFVAVVEVKNTSWDAIRPSNVRKNLLSHVRQLLAYVDEYNIVQKMEVAAAVIYPAPPTTLPLRQIIEEFYDDQAIVLVWFSEARPVSQGLMSEPLPSDEST